MVRDRRHAHRLLTRLGKHSYGYEVIEKEDPRGRKYYWIGGNEYQLHLDLTAHDLAAEVARWTVEGFPRVEVGSATSRTPS